VHRPWSYQVPTRRDQTATAGGWRIGEYFAMNEESVNHRFSAGTFSNLHPY
jgi:hypothetical protein